VSRTLPGIDLDGHKDVLGLWTSVNEGAKFWLQMLTDLRDRGVESPRSLVAP
jgi:putative transposase